LKFNIAHIGPEHWFNFKSDIIFPFYHSLIELGFDVSISNNQVANDRHNIIIGADWITKENAKKFYEIPFGYSIFEVEQFDGKTINNREVYDIDNYLELIHNAKTIISCYKYNQNSYENLGFGNKFYYLKWGYSDAQKINYTSFAKEKDFYSVFFGLLKGRRATLMKSIMINFPTTVFVVKPEMPFLMRDYFIRKSKSILNLSDNFSSLLNPFRIYCGLANGIPVISNVSDDFDGYSNLTLKKSDIEISSMLLDIKLPSANETFELGRSVELKHSLKLFFGNAQY
jgi:hypothetical protein